MTTPNDVMPEYEICPETFQIGMPASELLIAATIVHLLQYYPRMSHTMLQVKIGTNVSASEWRPIASRLIKYGIVREGTISANTITGRHRTHDYLTLSVDFLMSVSRGNLSVEEVLFSHSLLKADNIRAIRSDEVLAKPTSVMEALASRRLDPNEMNQQMDEAAVKRPPIGSLDELIEQPDFDEKTDEDHLDDLLNG